MVDGEIKMYIISAPPSYVVGVDNECLEQGHYNVVLSVPGLELSRYF